MILASTKTVRGSICFPSGRGRPDGQNAGGRGSPRAYDKSVAAPLRQRGLGGFGFVEAGDAGQIQAFHEFQ